MRETNAWITFESSKAQRNKVHNQSVAERKSMISGIHTKHHHPLKISMAGEKVPKDGAGNWHNVSKGKTKAIVKELDYQDVTSQTMVLVNKPKTNGKAAAVANPVGSFESPKINLCTNMILHGNKVTTKGQSKGSTNLGTPFVSGFSAMEISPSFSKKRVF
ncbi:hypothetical protein V6N13_061260 [Hibiscus sabdariffa]